MSRSLGPALLATFAASGCYDGREDADVAPASTTTITDPESTGGPSATGGDDGSDGHDGSAHEPGSTDVAISVVDRHGEPIAGARVHHGDHFHLTDGSKFPLVLTGLRGERQAIRVDADGWLSATDVVDLVPDRSMAARVTLLRRLPTDPAVFKQFDASEGIEDLEFADGAVLVSIPPGALVDRDGVQVTGPVAVSVVPIDVISAPGPLRTVVEGRDVPLRTLAMADVSVWQGDQELQPNGDPAFDVTLRYRMPVSAAEYPDIPAWYFDHDLGHWVEDPTALTFVDEDGYWNASVSHFTPWNADVAITELGCIKVTACLDDNCNDTAPFTPVTAEGIDYIVTELTDADGVACLEVPAHTVADDPNDPDYPINRVYLGLPGAPNSAVEELPLTSNASCGPPDVGCEELSFKLDPVCNLGFTQDCVYEGPPATIDTGMCSPPFRVCDGIAWGLCEGGHSPPDNVFDDGCLPEAALLDHLNPAHIAQYDADCDGLLEPKVGCGCSLLLGFDYPCYAYPSEYHLEEPNICDAGTIHCPQGGVAEECENSQDPGVLVEIDGNMVDENCDGSLTTLGPQMAARLYIGNPDDQHDQVLWDVAADTTYVYITGTFEHSIDLFDCLLTSDNGGAQDMFVARLDAINLKCDRAFQFTVSNSPADPMKVARATNGEIAVLSTCGGTLNTVTDLNLNTTTDLTGCSEDPTVFVAFFDQNFDYLKNQTLGIDADNATPDYVDARALAHDPLNLGRFLVAGGFTAANHGQPYASLGSEDMFVASYNLAGDVGSFHRVGPLSEQSAVARSTAIAVDPANGQILLAGTFNDGLYIEQDTPIMPGDGAFVVRFTDALAFMSSLRLAPTQNLEPTTLAVAPGTIYVGGKFSDDITITDANDDAVALVHGGLGDNDDGFLLPLAPDLTLRSPLVYHGGDSNQTVVRIALNAADEPHVAGNFTTELRVADKIVSNDGTPDAFVVKHTADWNAPLWIWNTGGSGFETVYGLAVAGDTAYIVGSAINSSGLGIPPGDAADGFLVRLKP